MTIICSPLTIALQGISRRWRRRGITDAQKPLEFSLVRVTGLKSPDDFDNTGLAVIQEDNDHLTQEWFYQHKGKIGKNIFHFTRVR